MRRYRRNREQNEVVERLRRLSREDLIAVCDRLFWEVPIEELVGIVIHSFETSKAKESS